MRSATVARPSAESAQIFRNDSDVQNVTEPSVSTAKEHSLRLIKGSKSEATPQVKIAWRRRSLSSMKKLFAVLRIGGRWYSDQLIKQRNKNAIYDSDSSSLENIDMLNFPERKAELERIMRLNGNGM